MITSINEFKKFLIKENNNEEPMILHDDFEQIANHFHNEYIEVVKNMKNSGKGNTDPSWLDFKSRVENEMEALTGAIMTNKD
jgi:hypothetical protein